MFLSLTKFIQPARRGYRIDYWSNSCVQTSDVSGTSKMIWSPKLNPTSSFGGYLQTPRKTNENYLYEPWIRSDWRCLRGGTPYWWSYLHYPGLKLLVVWCVSPYTIPYFWWQVCLLFLSHYGQLRPEVHRRLHESSLLSYKFVPLWHMY